jgi:hypothetical protein
MHRNRWQPILEGLLGERALVKVQEIIAALPGPESEEWEDPSLAGGAAGLSLLCAYLARAGLDRDENASRFLERAIQGVLSMPMSPSLYSGFTGIAWTVAHLQEQLLDAEDDTGEAIDEALKLYLHQTPWQDDYDLINGLAGFGVYAFERLPHAAAVECLRLIVDRLDETAERWGDGVTWLTRPHLLPENQREQSPDGYYNLGLAHGVPAVIALLGGVCAAGVAVEKARPMLDGAVRWLLRQQLITGAQSNFSSWISLGAVERKDCRLAWCY